MSAAILSQLKITVERIVRPVRARRRRKLKMRQELLAKAVALFEEDMAGSGDELAALARTEKHFASSTTFTRQLQQSVPRLESFAVLTEEYFVFPPDESTLGLAFWRSCGFGLICFAITLAGLFLCSLLDLLLAWDMNQTVSLRKFLVVLPMMAAAFFLCAFVLSSSVVFLAHGFWYALYGRTRRSWPQIILLVAASCAIGPIAICGIHAGVSNDATASLRKMLPVLPGSAVLTPYCLIFLINLTWRVLHGRPSRTWRQSILVDVAWCSIVSTVALLLGLAMSGDFWFSLGNPYLIGVANVCYLIPLDLVFSARQTVTGIRTSREWDSIQIDARVGLDG